MSTRDDLKQEATDLGLDFPSNIKTEKLEQLIEEHYQSQAAGDLVQAVEEVEEPQEEKTPAKANGKKLTKNQKLAEAKNRAMATKVVTLSSNDKRDNEYVTTAYLSFENQHFGLAKLVPLDIPVELEQGLINVAKETMITLHKDEVIDGKRTGNKIPVRTRKYNVSYEDMKPSKD